MESREKSCGPFSGANKRKRRESEKGSAELRIRRRPLNIYRHSAGETCTLILAADDLVGFPAGIINPESIAGRLNVLSVFTPRDAMNLKGI